MPDLAARPDDPTLPPGTPLELGGRIPIVVAVTGHRDIPVQDEAVLQAAMAEHLASLLAGRPHTPLVVLSPLARGADRIAAEAALSLRDSTARRGPDGRMEHRVHVVAPLPMTLPDYQASLEADQAGSSTAFLALLSRCQAWYPIEGMDDATDADGRELTAYHRLAAYLARNGHVLLMASASPLPDAPPPAESLDGGTSTAYAYARFGPPPSLDPDRTPLDAESFLDFWHLPVRRSLSIPTPELPRPRTADAAGVVFDQFEVFNRDADRVWARHATKVAARAAALRPDDSSCAAALSPCYLAYAAADAMADVVFKPILSRFRVVLFAGALLAVFLLEGFLHFWPGTAALLAAYFATTLGMVGWWSIVRSRRYQEKRLVYRSLAEALRLQVHWRWSGVRGVVSNHYASHLRNEIEWVRQALRGLHACTGICIPAESDATGRLRKVHHNWIRAQIDWFAQRIAGLERSDHRLHGAWLVLLVLGFACAASLFGGWSRDATHGLNHAAHLVAGCTILLLAGAGLLHAAQQQLASRALLRRYQAQQELLRRADQRLSDLDPTGGGDLSPAGLAAARRVLRELGTITLQESVTWLLLYRNRPLEIHFH